MRSMNPPTICLGRFYFHSFDLRSPKRGKRAKFSTQESQVGKRGGVCVGGENPPCFSFSFGALQVYRGWEPHKNQGSLSFLPVVTHLKNKNTTKPSKTHKEITPNSFHEAYDRMQPTTPPPK